GSARSASRIMKRARTTAIACVELPNTTEKSRTHVISYTSPAAPEKKRRTPTSRGEDPSAILAGPPTPGRRGEVLSAAGTRSVTMPLVARGPGRAPTAAHPRTAQGGEQELPCAVLRLAP